MKKFFLIVGVSSLFAMPSLAQDANIFIEKIKAVDSTTLMVKTKPNDKSLFLEIKDSEGITIYIDGKEYDSDILIILDQDKIGTVAVLKGEAAMKKYNKPNVILISTKKEKQKMTQGRIEKGTKDPIILIDGKPVNKECLKTFPVDDIESVNVWKDEESKKKYKTEVGVIMITTKAAHKKAEKQKKKY